MSYSGAMQVLEGIPGERERLLDSEKVGLAERLRFLRFEQTLRISLTPFWIKLSSKLFGRGLANVFGSED
jgi:hypothetical protein